MQTTKRFIAGAICPQCHLVDKLLVWVNQTGQPVCECVHCSYHTPLVDTASSNTLHSTDNASDKKKADDDIQALHWRDES